MDASRFDAQVRRLAAAHTRRGTLAGMAGFLAIPAVARVPVAAKKKAKKTTLCLDGQTIQASKEKKKKLLKQGATVGACPISPTGCTPTCSPTTCGGGDGCGGTCGCPVGSICHNGLCKTCDLACPS